MKKSQAFGCTNNLLLLPISGAFVILLGVLLIILYLVTRGLTTSLYHVEGPVPNFVPAIVLVTSGVFTAVLYIKPVRPLVFVSFILGLTCIILCSVHAITTLVIHLPFLNSLSICVEKPSISECQCYILEGSIHNKTLVTDERSLHFTFEGTSTCDSIERTLKDFLYVICIVYVFGLVACLFTTVLSILLWCRYQPPDREIREVTGVRTNDREAACAGSSAADTSSDPSSQQASSNRRESSSDQARVEEVRTVSTGRTESQRRRPTVQRSSSITTGQSNPAPRITRHHSVATADTSPPDQNRPRRDGNTQGRSRMPQILIRGGYLQSQLDGPTIPVYTLQGSNEAYISLTDLPSLQMPSLDSVPAFIPELPEPVPDDEPPPYSPEPQRFSPREGEGDSTLVNGEDERGTREDSNADEHIQVISQESVPTQDVGNDGEAAPISGMSDCPQSSGRSPSQGHSLTLRPDANLPGMAEGPVEETSGTSSASNGKPKPVKRKPSGSHVHGGRGNISGGRSTPISDEPKGEEREVLPGGKRISPKYGSVKDDHNGQWKDRERLKEVANIVSTVGGQHHCTGDSDPKQDTSKNKGRDDRTGGVKSGDKGGTRRKIPKVPDSNPARIPDKKQRIKEQVSEKSRSGRHKLHSESGDSSNKAHAKPRSHHHGNLPHTQIVTDKGSSAKNTSGAKPKERRKQKGPLVQEVKNLEKISNGSSQESLSEIVSLLESVKGGQEKQPKRKRSSALEEFNFPDSRV